MDNNDSNHIKIEQLTEQEVKNFLYEEDCRTTKIPLTKGPDTPKFQGFHYLGPSTINDYSQKDKRKYFVAIDEQDSNKILAVLKLGEYTCYDTLPKHWAIDFVDVRKDMQSKGIAKKLFKSLENFLNPQEVVVGTSPSKMCKDISLDLKWQNYIPNIQTFRNQEVYYKYCQERELLPQ